MPEPPPPGFKKAADPIRREANRRAAERSRGRQQEKIVALEMAVQTLSDENLRLKDEITRLEGRDVAPETLANMEPPPSMAPTESNQSLDAAAAAAVASHVQNQQFLDLLAQGGDIPWAQLLSESEAEVDGRLGQLAAVASNQAGEEPPQPAPADTTELGNPARTRPAPVSSTALTSELEKLLLEEIASVKNAIARADRELARRRGHQVFGGDVAEDSYQPIYPELYAADDTALAEHSTKAELDMAELDIQASVLREVTARMRASMEEEETKLLPLEEELRMLNVDGQRDREGVTAVLRAFRGHLTSLMSAPGGYMPGNLLVTPFSSPATARRRRGRPPKHAPTSSSAQYTFPYDHSPTSSDSGTDLPETPGGRPARASAPRRSRLAQELRFEPEHPQQPPTADAGASHALSGSVEANVVAETSQATHDYLLSHFAASDASRHTPITLDSSSFVALLPQSPLTDGHHQTLDSSLGASGPHIPEDTSNSLSETPNVMSRFKRGPPGSCDICSRTQTSVWRKLTYEGEELRVCNACGLYHSKFHIPRPPELWGDGRTIKKRKAGPRNWEGVKRRREQQRKSSQYGEIEGVMGMEVDHRVLEDPTAAHAVHAVGVAGSETPDPGLQHGLTTLQEVGQAVENMYAVQQQEAEQQEQHHHQHLEA
ncbi:hypothetical protein CspHIS471_0307130 [Cutaneotrichosporon sp. HIS471]|nr:hypothetical protein CspHIS471_0307130 [Cutaneotrichosporon sp. HIS471]